MNDLLDLVVELFDLAPSRPAPAPARSSARAERLAELLVLAALADGRVTDREWRALGSIFRHNADFEGDPEDHLERLRGLPASEIPERVRTLGDELGRDGREEALSVLAHFAVRGASLGVGTQRGGYRDAPTARDDDLVEVFGRALGFSERECLRALERARAYFGG